MSTSNDHIGIIAGGGNFPFMVADAARKRGFCVIAVAHHGETDPALAERVDKIIWIKLGQLGKLIKALKSNNVSRALMAGTIKKRRMFTNVSPDIKGLALISKMAIFHDDRILRALAEELALQGIEIVSSTIYLPELMTPQGCLTRRKPGKADKEDIRLGWKIAKELGEMDVGQCVVMRRRTVLALEAIDGTNETILRGGRLAGEKAVVIKVSKPFQDMRFDLPSVGLETLKVMSEVKASVLALEAGKTLMFEKNQMIDYADNHSISIVSIEDIDNF
ncbi:MAG: UDP-2,3-diacylglucosamine diphosphatase LpxI [Deltaproteobacteria bacterium]|nr:UDP-2,3-diacylglucosamine diphosphatase LpxI [Deltaproteobacteria bacterium]